MREFTIVIALLLFSSFNAFTQEKIEEGKFGKSWGNVSLYAELDGKNTISKLYQQHLNERAITEHFPNVNGNPADSTWIIYFNAATLNELSLGQ